MNGLLKWSDWAEHGRRGLVSLRQRAQVQLKPGQVDRKKRDTNSPKSSVWQSRNYWYQVVFFFYFHFFSSVHRQRFTGYSKATQPKMRYGLTPRSIIPVSFFSFFKYFSFHFFLSLMESNHPERVLASSRVPCTTNQTVCLGKYVYILLYKV